MVWWGYILYHSIKSLCGLNQKNYKMKKIILLLLLTILFSISAYAQIDSAQVENRLNQLEQQFQQLETLSSEMQVEIEKLGKTDAKLEQLESQYQKLEKKLLENQTEIEKLGRTNNTLQESILGLSSKSEELTARIDSLDSMLIQNTSAVNKLSQQLSEQKEVLSGRISETRETAKQRITDLNKALSKNTLYWIIAVLAVGFLSIFSFIFLRKKVAENQSTITESLANTRKELEQEAIRLDEKLIGIMETQLKVIQEEKKAQSETENSEQDHALALKVADEIVRIEKNISRMDKGTRGLKQLSKAVGRIKDNFASNGYEMVDMIGKPFDDGIKATANFIPDDSLNPGERVISRIIKPQVNYKGKMIQAAQIEVAQGE